MVFRPLITIFAPMNENYKILWAIIWFMRTNGYTPSNITYICDFGYLYNQGTAVTCDDAAVLPALTIDLTKAPWTASTPVTSTDIVQ